MPGLVSYRDIKMPGGKDAGVGYISREAIDRSMKTMVGRPLVIKHEPLDETGQKIDPVTPGNMERVADGYISRVWWGDDGWAWCEGTCHDDEAKDLARPREKGGKGWRVSCCYSVVGAVGPGGVLNGVPYNFEVKEFTGEHLALHPNPRYEGARIIMNGQKASTAMKLHIFGKKTETPAADKAAADKAAADKLAAEQAEAQRLANAKPEAIEIGPDTKVQIGEKPEDTATIGELIESHNAVKNGMEMDPEQEIEYAPGKRAKLGRLCQAMVDEEERIEKEKKNALVEGATADNRDDAGKRTATLTGPASACKNGVEAPKGGHFLRLVNAPQVSSDRILLKNAKKTVETPEARAARGRARWGAPPKLAQAGKN